MLALGGFGLFVALLCAALYLPSRNARADTQTWQQAQEAGGLLDSYISSKNKIPGTVKEAGFTRPLPKNVTYHKDSDSQFTFCISYKAAGTAKLETGSGTLYDYLNILPGRGTSDYGAYGGPTSKDLSKENLVIPVDHKAGKQCQTIKPRFTTIDKKGHRVTPLTESKEGHTIVCGTEVSRYIAIGPILGFEAFKLGLNNSATLQDVTMIKVNYSQIPGDAGATTYMYGPGSLIFDQDCKQLGLADLRIKDSISVYSIISPETGSVDIFLKQ